MSKSCLDTQWSPAEMHERERMADDYSRRCYVRRREKARRFGLFVQRMLAGSVMLFLWSCILALLLGAI